MNEPQQAERGLLDTSVLIGLNLLDPTHLPRIGAVSSISMAELAAGPLATDDSGERARRQHRLQQVEATFEALPFGDDAAKAFGRVYAATLAVGRKPRGRRMVDLLIAATAVGGSLPLYTANPTDFVGLEDLIDVFDVHGPPSPLA